MRTNKNILKITLFIVLAMRLGLGTQTLKLIVRWHTGQYICRQTSWTCCWHQRVPVPATPTGRITHQAKQKQHRHQPAAPSHSAPSTRWCAPSAAVHFASPHKGWGLRPRPGRWSTPPPARRSRLSTTTCAQRSASTPKSRTTMSSTAITPTGNSLSYRTDAEEVFFITTLWAMFRKMFVPVVADLRSDAY